MLAVVIAALAACGGGESGPFDGALDCEQAWSESYTYEEGMEASLRPIDAMQEWAGATYPEATWSIHVVDARTGTVVIDELEVAVLLVDELPSETFAPMSARGCTDFAP